jgi:hypothetical protein
LISRRQSFPSDLAASIAQSTVIKARLMTSAATSRAAAAGAGVLQLAVTQCLSQWSDSLIVLTVACVAYAYLFDCATSRAVAASAGAQRLAAKLFAHFAQGDEDAAALRLLLVVHMHAYE